MFGRGIYFADMCSKSAGYCIPVPPQNIGLMVLSEVALGNMQELKQAAAINQPPAGKNSVKGMGTVVPDVNASHVRSDGVIIPLGKPLNQNMVQNYGFLAFNEFIVYDEAQVNMQYLVKMKFG
jgi:poly [ADP-ribose] polymerase